MKHLSQCWHYSLEIICDKPCGEHFLIILSQTVFKQFLKRFCSNDSLELFHKHFLVAFCIFLKQCSQYFLVAFCIFLKQCSKLFSQTVIQVKQLVTADQSNSFAQSVISDVEGGPVCKRKEKVKASPQTGSIRICKHQTCTATIILIIIIIILTD